MPDPKDDRVSKTYQDDSGTWITEDYGRPCEAISEEIEEKIKEYEEVQKIESEEDQEIQEPEETED